MGETFLFRKWAETYKKNRASWIDAPCGQNPASWKNVLNCRLFVVFDEFLTLPDKSRIGKGFGAWVFLLEL